MIISTQGLSKLGFDKYTDFVLQDDSDGNGVYIKEWNSDKPQPSEAEITTAHNEWQTIYDNAQYARDRAEAYPSIADQLDKIYHSGVAGWKADIKVIKDANPKPE